MNINIWKCNEMNLWRWTVCDGSRPIIKQQSGQNGSFHEAMLEIESVIELNTSKT